MYKVAINLASLVKLAYTHREKRVAVDPLVYEVNKLGERRPGIEPGT